MAPRGGGNSRGRGRNTGKRARNQVWAVTGSSRSAGTNSGPPIVRNPTLMNLWSPWTVVKYTADSGLGQVAHFPVRLIFEASGGGTWTYTKGTGKWGADFSVGTAKNFNMVPIAWEIAIESISTSSTGACREGGIMVGFFNRSATNLAAVGTAAQGLVPAGYPDSTTTVWSDIGFVTPRSQIGNARTYKMSQPPWAKGWTLEECHTMGKAFLIRWTSSTTIEFNVSIRFAYQQANNFQ